MNQPFEATTHSLLVEAFWLSEPLKRALRSPPAFGGLLRSLGYYEVTPTDVESVFDELQLVSDSIEDILSQEPESFSNPSAILQQIMQSIRELDDSVSLQHLVGDTQLFFRRLFDHLLWIYLQSRWPLGAVFFEGAGVAVLPDLQSSPSSGVAPEAMHFRWDRLGTLMRDPEAWAAEAYGWGEASGAGEATFDFAKAITALARMVEHTGLALAHDLHLEQDDQPDPSTLLGSSYSKAKHGPITLLELPLFQQDPEETDDGAPVFLAPGRPKFRSEAGLKILPYGDISKPKALGLAITPYASGDAVQKHQLSENLSLEVSIDAALDQEEPASYIALTPEGSSVALGSEIDAGFDFVFRYPDPDGESLDASVLFGDSGGTRVQITQVHLAVGGRLDGSLRVSAGVGGAKAVVNVADDALLSVLLDGPVEIPLERLALVWRSGRGISFDGGSSLDVRVPLNLKMGPLNFQELHCGLDWEEALKLGLRLRATLALGPVKATVEGLGLEIRIQDDAEGILGNYGLDFSFLPPVGLGLTIDTGPVAGGGYLFFDHEREEYAGALQIEFGEVSLKAMGLLTTRMPDGSKGFSLLVIITAEFSPAIQLGFGFNLSGVGGLLGVNRSVVVDVLRDGLRSNTLDSILFPDDPVNNAPTIISNLRSVFPPAQDQYVFGPVAKITWGTPKILTVELGVVLELPSPLRLIVMGRIRMLLPDERAPLININLDALGVVDFDAQEISLDATLFDSRLVAYTLTGDMAMRMTYGKKPQFALSVGGLHPSFEAPPKFPSLDRVAISLSAGNNPRIRLEAYLAITSNTAQLGARLDLYAAKGKFSLEGTLGFDALFQFSPFQFVVDIDGSVKLKRGSRNLMAVTVDLSLSGPSPWHAHGKATFRVLRIKGSVSFDKTIGREQQVELPYTDVWSELEAALSAPSNWSAFLPDEGHMFVTLEEAQEPDADADNESPLRVHPLGALTVRQRVVPLRVDIEKFGNTRPSGANRFEIESVQIGDGAPQSSLTSVKEDFAPAQFIAMTDSEKLSSPSFERMQAGVRIGAPGALVGTGLQHTIEYKELIVDKRRGGRMELEAPFARWSPGMLQAITLRSSAAQSGLLHTGNAKYRGPSMGIQVQDKSFAVVDTAEVRPAAVNTFNDSSYTEAAQALKRYAGANSVERAKLQVVETHEVAR